MKWQRNIPYALLFLALVLTFCVPLLVCGCGASDNGGNASRETSPPKVVDTTPRPYYFKIVAGSQELAVTREELDAQEIADDTIRFEIERDGFYVKGSLQNAPFAVYDTDEQAMHHELTFGWMESEHGDCQIVMGDEASELERIAGNISNHTALDVTRVSNLRHLCSSSNGYTEMDVSQNPRLGHLGIGDNKLVSLDVSNNPELWSVSIEENPLVYFDASNNPKIRLFYAHSTLLTELDLSMCPNLEDLDFSHTPLRVIAIPWMDKSYTFSVGSDFKYEGVDKLTVRRFPGSTATVISRNTEVTYVNDLK